MKLIISTFFISSCILLISCNNDQKIISLLESKKTNEVVEGAHMAGESKDKKFVPYLLKNAADVSTSTHIRFKGFTIYEQKMFALKRIFDKEPPKPITGYPDSAIIKFYTALSETGF